MAFTHLHLHSEYSLLDGACRIEPLLEAVAELGQTSVALTDHGVMYGIMDFYQAAVKKGIKPIIGCECYVAARTRHDKQHIADSERYHLILLCKNNKGYENLIAMVSESFINGFYVKPRIDRELLEKHHEGLIALSGCLMGEIPRALARGDEKEAMKTALWYQELFGEDFYLEIQNHGLREQLEIIPGLHRLSKKTGIRLVATNDVHYIRKEDAEIQRILLCIQTNHTLQENTGLEFATDAFYLKSEEEMRSVFESFPDAVDNTQVIAEQCNVTFEFGKTKLPHFEVPNDEDHFSYFKRQCEQGLRERKGEDPPKEYIERLQYELEVIRNMGYVDYYLIVHDFVRFAKSRSIPVGPGRGSGAGSLCAYCIGITGIDPMRYQLLFERFLNPERVSMPDFDIDFCYVRRQEVIDYVIEKYGSDRVAQIVTFGTMAARAAVRDVGRVLGYSYATVDNVAKLIPTELKITIDKALMKSAPLKELYESDQKVRHLIDYAKKVEGMPRHCSTHAAGVVITAKPVSAYVPLATNDDAIVTQYTMTALEQLGLLKMDFLGLRTLTVISDAEKMIRQKKPDFSVNSVDVADKQVYEMFSQAKTDGVFQFESDGMRSVLSRLKPECLEDLIAVISLYRPGPADSIETYINNRHHPEQTVYKTEKLREILSVTYGCLVYQEQVMQVFRSLAGYSFGRADIVRRAMAKKKDDVMQKERNNFIYGLTNENGTQECCGCVKNGIDEQTATEIFDSMTSFAKYAFNKSHAAAYAYVSYQTAYLKCHYPCELLAATLTSVLDSSNKVAMYIEECNRLKIQVLAPHINESEEGFTVHQGKIRFGLLAVKNLGRNLIERVITERKSGEYTSFYSFCKRIYGREFNRRAAESLIKCGACDGLGMNRHQMLVALPTILSELDNEKSRNIEGQMGLFDFGTQERATEFRVPQVEEFSSSDILAMEREVTGLYFSGHPMAEYEQISQSVGAVNIAKLLESTDSFSGTYRDNQKLVLLGLITSVEKRNTKNDSIMCIFGLEDRYATIECIAFSKVYAEAIMLLQTGTVVLIHGRLSLREERPPTVICESIEPSTKNIEKLNEAVRNFEKRQRPGLFLRVDKEDYAGKNKVENLLSVFDGNFPVYYYFNDTKKYQAFTPERWITPDEVLLLELKRILGQENVVFRPKNR